MTKQASTVSALGSCPSCGKLSLRNAARPGRVVRYRNTTLTLPTALGVPTCRRCRQMVLTSVPGLQKILAELRRADLCARSATSLRTLSAFRSQRSLEADLDLSQGYLSRLKAGDGVPSPALVSLLALLSADPSRLGELERYWAVSAEPVHASNPSSDLRQF